MKKLAIIFTMVLSASSSVHAAWVTIMNSTQDTLKVTTHPITASKLGMEQENGKDEVVFVESSFTIPSHRSGGYENTIGYAPFRIANNVGGVPSLEVTEEMLQNLFNIETTGLINILVTKENNQYKIAHNK